MKACEGFGELTGCQSGADGAQPSARARVALERLTQEARVGRLAAERDEERAQPFDFQAIELPGGRVLPGRRHVQQKTPLADLGAELVGQTPHLVAGGCEDDCGGGASAGGVRPG